MASRHAKRSKKQDGLSGLVLDEDEVEFKEEIEDALSAFETAEVAMTSGVQDHAGWSMDTLVKRTDKECGPNQQLMYFISKHKDIKVSMLKQAWFTHMSDLRASLLAHQGTAPCIADTLSEAVDTYRNLFNELQDALESGYISVKHSITKPLRRSARLKVGAKRKR